MQRTVTFNLTTFSLPQGQAIYDFSNETDGIVKMTIPAQSRYGMPHHWHETTDGCVGVETLSGQMQLDITHLHKWGSETDFGPVSKLFDSDDIVGWRRVWHSVDPLVVQITVDDPVLHRNIGSSILDAEAYPHLRTTPLWLRLLCKLPRVKKYLVPRLLWVQLRCIYHKHDFHTDEGSIPMTRFLRLPFQGPSDWAVAFQKNSMILFSTIVLTICYWLGVLLLGMKPEYEEYGLRNSTAIWT